jgi:hypothetical protein
LSATDARQARTICHAVNVSLRFNARRCRNFGVVYPGSKKNTGDRALIL